MAVNDMIEPEAEAHLKSVPGHRTQETHALILQTSQAISLKRIANYLSEIRTTVAEHAPIREAVKGLEERVGKQTSPEVSSLAAKYLAIGEKDIWGIMMYGPMDKQEALVRDLQTLAASCLSQDETPPKPYKGGQGGRL